MVDTIEEAQIHITTAMKILEQHDQIIEMLGDSRAKFEMIRAGFGKQDESSTPEAFNLMRGSIENKLESFKTRVLASLDAPMTWTEFRVAVSKANTYWQQVSHSREGVYESRLWEDTTPESKKAAHEDRWTPGEWEECYQRSLDEFFKVVSQIKINEPSGIVTVGNLKLEK